MSLSYRDDTMQNCVPSLTVPHGRATISVLTPRPRLSDWLCSALRKYSAQLKGGNYGKRLAALEAVDAEVASIQREDLTDLLSNRYVNESRICKIHGEIFVFSHQLPDVRHVVRV